MHYTEVGEWNKEKAGFCPSSDLHQLKSNNCYQNLSCGEPCISQVFVAIRNFCFLFPWNSTLNKPRTLFLFGLSYMLVVSVLLYNATYFICHWKGLTYLWSISFWMSLFSSSTFCCSFFLLCSGGRLLKSSGPAPCTAWDGGEEERKKKKKKEKQNSEPERILHDCVLKTAHKNLCKITMVWSIVILCTESYQSLNGQKSVCLRNNSRTKSQFHTKWLMGDHQLKNARIQQQNWKIIFYP